MLFLRCCLEAGQFFFLVQLINSAIWPPLIQLSPPSSPCCRGPRCSRVMWQTARNSPYALNHINTKQLGFPGGSDSKESACSAEALSSLPGPGRSPGEENATHSSILAWKSSMDRGAWQATVHGVRNSTKWLSLSLKTTIELYWCASSNETSTLIN